MTSFVKEEYQLRWLGGDHERAECRSSSVPEGRRRARRGDGGRRSPPVPAAVAAATKKKTVYRLSTHGTHGCDACKGHGANQYYRLPIYADQDRAHGGCNCRIVTQRVSNGLFQKWFRLPHGGLSPVFDVRSRAA